MSTSPTRTPPAPASLKVAVLGAGKIGSAFALQLASVGHHEVTVIARPGSTRLEQLRRDGGIVDVNGAHASVRVLDTLDEDTPYDLLIVTLLDHQTQALLSSLKRSAANCILFTFNSFHPERLQDAVGSARCTFGMPFIQATLDPVGKLKTTIGAGGQKTLVSEQRWADMFNAASLPAAVEPDMPLWLRCHVPLCIAFESVAVAAKRRGSGASWGEALVLARGVHASFGLIKGLGYSIYPAAKKLIDASPVSVLAATLWSMSRVAAFREVLATGKAEAQVLVEVLIAAAPLSTRSVDVSRIKAMKPL